MWNPAVYTCWSSVYACVLMRIHSIPYYTRPGNLSFPFILTRGTYADSFISLCVVSQGVSCGLWKVRYPLRYSWLLVISTEGRFSGLTWEYTEAGKYRSCSCG